MTSITIAREYISNAETLTEKFYNKTALYLHVIARVCLTASYIEDGIRMLVQWSTQVGMVDESWGCGYFVASATVLVILLDELVGSGMVLLQKKVPFACGFLFCATIIKTATLMGAYNWNYKVLLRDLSLIGGVSMLLAESQTEVSPLITGRISVEETKHRNYLQLCGRCLLVLMFLTTLRYDHSLLMVLQDVFGCVLMVFVTIGYKTELCAFSLTVFLAILNIYENNWWNASEQIRYIDYVKFEFFQALSVVGGLLLVVLLGPGRMSVDELKKNW